jgi:hypothetical protein
MQKSNINSQRGVIKYIIIVIASIVLIAYFRNDIQEILNSPKFKDALLVAIGWIQTALMWVVSKLGWTESLIK